MINIITTDNYTSVEVNGTLSDVTADLCHVIKSMYDDICSKYDADVAKTFVGNIRKFMNDYDFAISADENLKRQETLHNAIDELNKLINKYSK